MMPDANLTDTDKRIVMKDHDILIQVTTQLSELIRRFDESIRIEQERNTNFTVEMKGVSLEQVRASTQIASLSADFEEHKRMDADWKARWEMKSNWITGATAIGVIVAGVIAWFKG
jgi:hypothetical protein